MRILEHCFSDSEPFANVNTLATVVLPCNWQVRMRMAAIATQIPFSALTLLVERKVVPRLHDTASC